MGSHQWPDLADPRRCRRGRAPTIEFRRRSGFGAEAYRVEVTPQRITVSATTSAGLFYGAITLWQLLPPGPGGGEIAAQTIIDEPRYPWRGLMLDSVAAFSIARLYSLHD